MPAIAIFYGIIIKMFFGQREHNPHTSTPFTGNTRVCLIFAP